MERYIPLKDTVKEVKELLDKQEKSLKYQYKELAVKRKNYASNLISYPMNEEDRWHTTNAFVSTVNKLNVILESLEKIKDIRHNMMLLEHDMVGLNYHGTNEEEL